MCGVRPASLTLKVMNSSEELVDAPAEGPFGPGWASVAVMASTRRQTLAVSSLASAAKELHCLQPSEHHR